MIIYLFESNQYQLGLHVTEIIATETNIGYRTSYGTIPKNDIKKVKDNRIIYLLSNDPVTAAELLLQAKQQQKEKIQSQLDTIDWEIENLKLITNPTNP